MSINAKRERNQRRKEKYVSLETWLNNRLGTHMQVPPTVGKRENNIKQTASENKSETK